MTAPQAKAILLRLKQVPGSGKNAPTRLLPEDNGAFEVQFNPTSLKISRQNNIDKGGSTTRTQRRTTPSQQSATLTFDLEFDTAEGDDSGEVVDVRTKTLIVRQFAEPTKEKPKDPPPPVRFIWGSFTFTGIVTQVTEDLDYFSTDGKPLRAKVSVTITEQNADFEAKLTGSAAMDAKGATPAGGGTAASSPGSPPVTNPTSAAVAQGGESLQQLLSRLDADPATWRAAMAGLDSPLGLAAGAQVQLGARVSAGLGIGVSGGFAAGTQLTGTASLAGALGMSGGGSAGADLSAGAGVSAGADFSAGADAGFVAVAGGGVAAGSGEVAAGFVLAEGGGVAASFTAVAGAQSGAMVAQTRGAFEVPGRAAAVVTTGPGLPPPPRVDPRSTTFGRGVPLRVRVEVVDIK